MTTGNDQRKNDQTLRTPPLAINTTLSETRYNEAVGVYEYKHREWERLEVERKERLSTQCHQSRLDYLSLDSLAALTK